MLQELTHFQSIAQFHTLYILYIFKRTKNTEIEKNGLSDICISKIITEEKD